MQEHGELYRESVSGLQKALVIELARLNQELIPGTYLMENFKALISNQNLARALWNSFRNSSVLTILCLLVCSLAGYGFEIYHDKAKDIVFTILLTAMMVPFAAVMIPMFRMFSQLKMVNTMAAFMLLPSRPHL